MARTHYHVGQNVAGYSPDNEVETYATKSSAQAAMKWHADLWRDERPDSTNDDYDYFVRGNQRDGYVIDYHNNPTMLPVYIWLSPCTDDCEIDAD